MTDPAPTVDALIYIAPTVAIVVGLGVWVGKVSKQGDLTSKETEANRQKIHDLSNSLMGFRESVAKEYASKDMLADFKKELIDAINGLSARLDRLFESRN